MFVILIYVSFKFDGADCLLFSMMLDELSDMIKAGTLSNTITSSYLRIFAVYALGVTVIVYLFWFDCCQGRFLPSQRWTVL